MVVDEIIHLANDAADAVYGLDALAQPSLDPIFWRAERLGTPSAWWQHVPFAHWIVTVFRPQLLVELGTQAGVSYSAFCQAVVRANLETRCYAVDTWLGDAHAGFYGEDVFEDLSRFHDPRYASFSTLLRSTFDEALSHFSDGTVDLLHIDGLHTYEAARHDFESWRPKISARGIVMFHDTNERAGDFGVWRLWNELRQQFPGFEFLHGHGLGVLAVGNNMDPAISALCELSDPASVARVRGRFAVSGERWSSETRERLLAQDLDKRAAEARGWEARAREQAQAHEQMIKKNALAREQIEKESAHAREQIEKVSAHAREQMANRIDAARRDVYEANLRAEKALAEHDAILRERNAILFSTTWRATWPLRVAGERTPAWLRRAVRAGAKIGWWSLTLQLPRKLRERRGL
jgi:Methyltransferase domain